MIQCGAYNQLGHLTRDCYMEENPQRSCRWYGPGDHEHGNCPGLGVNLLNIESSCEEEELAITRAQAKKATYPNP